MSSSNASAPCACVTRTLVLLTDILREGRAENAEKELGERIQVFLDANDAMR